MNKVTKQHIRESNLIEGIDDPKEDGQSMYAWEWLQQWDFPIALAFIMRLQKRITINQNLPPNARGYIRGMAGNNSNVRVGAGFPPEYHLVPALIENWCHDMNGWKYLDPKLMHIRFEQIHPFLDGNGRTGRMLMWCHEIALAQKPTLFLNSEKQDYYKWFKEPWHVQATAQPTKS